MKKRTRKDTVRRRVNLRRWLIKLRRKKKDGSRHSEAVIVPPAQLSFSKSGQETVAFLARFKDAALKRRRVNRRGRWFEAPLFLDLATVERMSVPVAVTLAAELHRWVLLRGVSLRAKNIKQWSDRVVALMKALGVFELLGVGRRKQTAIDPDEIVLLKLISGEKNENEEIQRLQTNLSELSQVFSPKPYVFEGLSEAVLNCIDHAYPPSGQIKPKYPYAGHRWWATGCFDTNNSSFRFFVYDQGVGIPQTVGDEPTWKKLVSRILDRLGMDRSDANVILGAFEVGRTRTGLGERGKGLEQMRAVIAKAGGGYIRVISGNGDISLNATQVLEKRSHSSHIGGTLVEWSMPVDVFDNG